MIFAAALLVLPNHSLDEAKPVEAIMVDITIFGDVTKKMAMSKDAEKTVDKPKAKAADVVKKADPKTKIDKTEITAASLVNARQSRKRSHQAGSPRRRSPRRRPSRRRSFRSLEGPDQGHDQSSYKPPEKKVEPKPEKKVEPKPDKPKPEKKPAKKQEKLDVAKLEDILNSDAMVNKENEEKTTNASEATDAAIPWKCQANLQGADDQLVGTHPR